MDNRSSLIPICLILTSGASLRASLSWLEEKHRTPTFLARLVDNLSSLDLPDRVIVPDLSITFRSTFINVVAADYSAMRRRWYLLVVYIVTVLPHRPLARRSSLFVSSATLPSLDFYVSSSSPSLSFLSSPVPAHDNVVSLRHLAESPGRESVLVRPVCKINLILQDLRCCSLGFD